MYIKTNKNQRSLTLKNYINQPMQMAQLNLNMIIAKNPKLLLYLDRSFFHPLIRKKSNIPTRAQ